MFMMNDIKKARQNGEDIFIFPNEDSKLLDEMTEMLKNRDKKIMIIALESLSNMFGGINCKSFFVSRKKIDCVMKYLSMFKDVTGKLTMNNIYIVDEKKWGIYNVEALIDSNVFSTSYIINSYILFENG